MDARAQGVRPLPSLDGFYPAIPHRVRTSRKNLHPRIKLRDNLFPRKRGELAFAPRNVPHTFANLSGADARTLIVCTPAGFERYFDLMAARAAGVEPDAMLHRKRLRSVVEQLDIGPTEDESM